MEGLGRARNAPPALLVDTRLRRCSQILSMFADFEKRSRAKPMELHSTQLTRPVRVSAVHVAIRVTHEPGAAWEETESFATFESSTVFAWASMK
jgi:hypothetical protein